MKIALGAAALAALINIRPAIGEECVEPANGDIKAQTSATVSDAVQAMASTAVCGMGYSRGPVGYQLIRDRTSNDSAPQHAVIRPFEDACNGYVTAAYVGWGSIEWQKRAHRHLSLCNQSPDRRVCTLAVEKLREMKLEVPAELKCDGKAIPVPAENTWIDYDKACRDLAATAFAETSADPSALIRQCSAHPSKANCETVGSVFEHAKKSKPAGLRCRGR